MNGIYIHIPFCREKCKYCDFHSFKGLENEYERYAAELTAEITANKDKAQGNIFSTVYIGGGTPSVLPINYLEQIINTVYKNFSLDLKEFTVEQNPESAGNFDKLKEMGVNRLSFGVQSLNDISLKAIGRIHNSEQALSAITKAREYIDNISADLMLGLPFEDKDSVINNIKTLAPLIRHISAYMLTLEKNTPLYNETESGIIKIADEEEISDIYLKTVEILGKYGFNQYEISNFCKNDQFSLHNKIYWEGGEYLGFGAGASSYFNKIRYKNPLLKDYLKGIHSGNGKEIVEEVISKEEEVFERIMLSLRTVKGLDLNDAVFLGQKDKLFKIINQIYNKYNQYSYFENSVFRLNPKGFLISNTIITDILALS